MSDAQEIAKRLRPYYSAEEIAEWLCSPHPQLGGELPADVIARGEADQVVKIIDRLDADGYI